MRVKTTLELERPLYLALKQRASSEHKTLKKVMDEIIIASMAQPEKKPSRRSKEIFPRAKGLGPKFPAKNAAQLLELVDAEDFLPG